jgi:RIO kinase 1
LRHDVIEHFLDEGLVDRVLRPLQHGKEGSVHLVRANPRTTGEELAALKVFHPLDRRDFRDESLYRDGEWIKERRIRVALEKKTRFGREAQGAIWVDRERETLALLSEAGLPVPRPIHATQDAILMTYIGDRDAPAPRLHEYRADDAAETQDLLAQILRAVERMLFRDVVHGDLSAYNLLVWEGSVTVIDFPQAIDVKKNRHARELLGRDVHRIGEHFERLGIRRPWDRIAADLWTAWEFAELVPEDLRWVADNEGA